MFRKTSRRIVFYTSVVTVTAVLATYYKYSNSTSHLSFHKFDYEDSSRALVPFPFETPFNCTNDLDEGRMPVVRALDCTILDPVASEGLHSTSNHGTTLSPISHVDPKSLKMVDIHGRERYFRGVNIAYKLAPFLPLTEKWHPSRSLSASDLKLFSRLGLNVIRLGVPWAAVQPQPPKRNPKTGQIVETENDFDLEYLARVLNLIRDCAKEGIYVLISAHQDLYSESFCGDGMPTWSISSDQSTFAFPQPISGFTKANYGDGRKSSSFPQNLDCELTPEGNGKGGLDDWGKYYLSDAVTRAFWGLYTNESGLTDAFARYWREIARTLSQEPNLLGYELLNEPFLAANTWWKALFGFVWKSWGQDRTERDYLGQLYDRVERAIREGEKEENKKIVFFQPVTGNAGGDGFRVGEGMLKEGWREKVVMAYHVYGKNVVNFRIGDEEDQIKTRQRQGKNLAVGTMMTEFNIEYGDQGNRLEEIARTIQVANSHLVSWIGWQYKEFFRVSGDAPAGSLISPQTGNLRSDMARIFSRPYPEAVAGELISLEDDMGTDVVRLRFVANGKNGNFVNGKTVIRISEDSWGYGREGFGIEVKIEQREPDCNETDVGWRKVDEGRIEVSASKGCMGQSVQIIISPKRQIKNA